MRALEDERANEGERARKRARWSVVDGPAQASPSIQLSQVDQLQPSQSHHVNQFQSPQPNHLKQHQPYQPQRPNNDTASRKKSVRLGEPPIVHTASAFQMLHSWPRPRVCLDNELTRSASYNEQAEDPKGDCGFHYYEPIEAFYQDLPQLPLAMQFLFETSPWLGKGALDKQVRKHESEVLSVEGLKSLDTASWIVLSMALRIYDDDEPGSDGKGKE